jgi:lipopolysaccharide heptosyltransferase I
LIRNNFGMAMFRQVKCSLMQAPQKILVIRLSSLGDILHALPAFQSLRRSFPDARIDWLVEERTKFILSAVPGLNRIISIDTVAPRRKPLSRSSWASIADATRALRRIRYDLSIDFQGLIKTGLLGFLSGARTRLGFGHDLVWERPAHWFYNKTVEQAGEATHIVALNQLLANAVGAGPAGGAIDLKVPEAMSLAVAARLEQQHLGNFAIINPGGGWPTKRWSLARYGALAERLAIQLGMQVVVTTGPGEESLYQGLSANCTVVLHHFPIPFLELIPLMGHARLFISGDTGPFHLACALGVPVVGIFGPTSPARNGPWSARDEAVVHPLPCSYCHGRSCPTQNECMDIPVDEVYAAVLRRLEAV